MRVFLTNFMANLSKVIYINEEDYSTLLNGGTITKGGVTYSHDPTALYVIKNVSAPEYAETAGYATTAGQATKATQDGGGNVISETYAKKAVVGTLTNNNNVWSCDKTHKELTNAILAGNLVYLTAPNWSNQAYYPKKYPYPDGNGNYNRDLQFQSLESQGYCERFDIHDDNSIENEEIDFEAYLSEDGRFKQRIILKLTIGNSNTLSFKNQDNQNIDISGANWLIRYSQDDQDVVIQYNDREYRKQAYESDNSCIAFVSVDLENYLLYYLSFDCSSTNTVTLIENTSIPIISENVDLGQAYGISSNNSNSAIRTSSISGFKLKEGGIVAIKFTTDINITNPGLNISSTGAKPMYYRGSTLLRGTVNAGDTVTFIYDGTYYHIISIDKDIPDPATTAPLMDGTATVGSSTQYAKEDHVHPSDTSKANVADLATVATSGSYNDLTDKPTASDVGAITRFVVDFTLSGTTISNPNKTFLQIKAAYDAGDLVLARDNNSSLYYLLYCDTGECGFFNCDSNYLYDINVDSSNVWRYQITDISQLSHDLSNKSEVIYIQKINNDWRKVTYNNVTGTWSVNNTVLTTGNTKNIYLDKDNNDLYYWDGSAFVLIDEDNVQPDWDQSDSTKADYIKNKPVIPNSVKVGSVAGKLYRNDVNGSGNFTVKGNSGCIPNLIAGTFFVSIYAKSDTQSYTFRFNFGSVSYDLSTTNGEISDVRQITLPSNGTFSGLVANGSVASGTILYVVMYNYLTTISTVGPAAVTNRYSDLDGTPTIPTVNNGTLTIQQNGITVGTFTANQSNNTTANIYSTMFGTLGQSGFERDNYNSSTGNWEGVEIVTPNPLVTYVDILSDKLYRYDPITTNYVDLGGSGNITSTAITNLTDIL